MEMTELPDDPVSIGEAVMRLEDFLMLGGILTKWRCKNQWGINEDIPYTKNSKATIKYSKMLTRLTVRC